MKSEAMWNEDEEMPEEKFETEWIRMYVNKGTSSLTAFRLPNFINFDSLPFDEELDKYENFMTSLIDENRLYAENCIRWKRVQKEDGQQNLGRESNAKFVRWSDGTVTLCIGNVHFAVKKEKPEGLVYGGIVNRDGLSNFIHLRNRIGIKLLNTDNEAHKKIVMSAAEKRNSMMKTRVVTDLNENPEKRQATLVRLENERLRAEMRREAQKRRDQERTLKRGLTREFLEDIGDLPPEHPQHEYNFRQRPFDIFDDFRAFTVKDEKEEEEKEKEPSRIFDSSDEEETNSGTNKKLRRRIVSDDEEDLI